jgi:hypothetical protein
MEGIMETKKMMSFGLVILLGLGFLTGCSNLSPNGSGTASSAPDGGPTPPPNTLTPYQYPPEAEVPPAGYHFVALVPETEDPSLDHQMSWAYIYKPYGGQVWLQGSGVVIQPNGVPYSTWISITKETSWTPWVDYGPHGLIFNGAQNARMNYAGCYLGPGVTPQNLTIWYWNETTNLYEYIGGTNNPQMQCIEYQIYHFSRYVVAAAN